MRASFRPVAGSSKRKMPWSAPPSAVARIDTFDSLRSLFAIANVPSAFVVTTSGSSVQNDDTRAAADGRS